MNMTQGHQRNWICFIRGIHNFSLLPPEVELQSGVTKWSYKDKKCRLFLQKVHKSGQEITATCQCKGNSRRTQEKFSTVRIKYGNRIPRNAVKTLSLKRLKKRLTLSRILDQLLSRFPFPPFHYWRHSQQRKFHFTCAGKSEAYQRIMDSGHQFNRRCPQKWKIFSYVH